MIRCFPLAGLLPTHPRPMRTSHQLLRALDGVRATLRAVFTVDTDSVASTDVSTSDDGAPMVAAPDDDGDPDSDPAPFVAPDGTPTKLGSFDSIGEAVAAIKGAYAEGGVA